MRCKIFKVSQISGCMTSVYSVIIDNNQDALFDKFLKRSSILFKSETIDILKRLYTIGNTTGAREHFFKLNEGSPGDGVCALFDSPDKNLRLYCIRYGSQIIILGNGGIKEKSIRTLQEDSHLKEANYFLRRLSYVITEKIKSKEIYFSGNGLEFEGELEFDI